MEILYKHENFVQKWKFCTNMKILSKNGNFVQSWKFCTNMKILSKNLNFFQKSKFCPKIEILSKNLNKSDNLVKNFQKVSKCSISTKFSILDQDFFIGQKFDLWPKYRFSAKI